MDSDVRPSLRIRLADALLRKPALGMLRMADRLGVGMDTEEVLLQQLDHADEEDVIDGSQKEMITNIIDLDDVAADDIMTHRMEMVALDENTTCGKALEIALDSGYSRLPIYHKSVDDIIGFLYVKDLLTMFTNPEQAEKPVTEFLHPAMFVPESRGAQELLLDFKRNHTMVAVVVDEYGGTAGLVSMEDILEEIVGDIQDEYDDEEDPMVPCEGGFIADGSVDLEDLFEAFQLPLPESEEEDEHDSVGDLLLDLLDHIPQEGECVQVAFGGLVFEPTVIGERRVEKVRCTREPQKEPEGIPGVTADVL